MKKKNYLTPDLEVISLVSMKETLAAASAGVGGVGADITILPGTDFDSLFNPSL